MKKAEYKFHRDKKHQIENASKENEPFIFNWYSGPSNKPIFIPRRKKKK